MSCAYTFIYTYTIYHSHIHTQWYATATNTHTHTHSHAHTPTITRKVSYKIPTVFVRMFRISIHFILLTAWWLLYCKNSMKPRGRRLNFMALYIYIYIWSCGCAFLPWRVDLVSLISGMNWWPYGRSSYSTFWGCWFDL